MPKARVERILADDGKMQTVEIEAAAGGEEKGVTTTQYERPTLAYFKEYVLNLSDTDTRKAEDGTDTGETWAKWGHRVFTASLDRMARASVYESIAAESTLISVGKERVDIMTFPLAKLVKAINGLRGTIEARLLPLIGKLDEVKDAAAIAEARKSQEDAVGFGPWRVAARKLVEQGNAREDTASGTLVLIG